MNNEHVRTSCIVTAAALMSHGSKYAYTEQTRPRKTFVFDRAEWSDDFLVRLGAGNVQVNPFLFNMHMKFLHREMEQLSTSYS